MKHVVIITGGDLNIDFAKAYLKTLSYDKVFAVDKGLEYVDALGIVPDYLVGDFDTVNPDVLMWYEKRIQSGEISTCIERHPAKKDATDTELAINQAIKMNAESITLLAGTGNRIDHLLANLELLIKASEHNVKMYVIDPTNRIRLMTQDFISRCIITKKEQHGKYFSLVPLTPKVEGVSLKGALYPLEQETICQGNSLTVSNQIVGDQVEIGIMKGKMLVIESRDK